jgi:hypothetical protein
LVCRHWKPGRMHAGRVFIDVVRNHITQAGEPASGLARMLFLKT